ncbi:hypothetical protein TNCV_572481 [Trichonephila clavipes]|nr:hypothetical protein TNCV_572481 [Trichonephila clavipes]
MPSAIFQRDNARLHVVCNVQDIVTPQIEFIPLPACSPELSPIKSVWSMLAQLLARDTRLAAIPDPLWQYVEAASGYQIHLEKA